MRNALSLTLVGTFMAMMFFSSGCEDKSVATDTTPQSTPGGTKVLEAVDLVGYDGKRLRRSVDRVKDLNDKHNQDLEKIGGSGPDQ